MAMKKTLLAVAAAAMVSSSSAQYPGSMPETPTMAMAASMGPVAEMSPFEKALDALPPMPPVPQADAAVEASFARFAEEREAPKTTIVVTKRHPDGTTTTATIVKHGDGPSSEASEESSSGAGAASEESSSEASEGSEESSSEASEGSEESSEDAAPAPAGKGRKHIITTTTTTVTRKIVPLPTAADAPEEDSAELPADKVKAEEKNAEKAEESAEAKSAKKEAADVAAAKKKEAAADAEEKKAEESSEESSEAGEPEEPAELREKRARLSKLSAELTEQQKKYQAEHDWLSKAMHLIATLHEKTNNVRLHLNDAHKDMVRTELKRKSILTEVHQLENQISTQRRMRRLNAEMEAMIKHAAEAKAQMDQLAARRENFAARVAEVRGALAELKQQQIAKRATSNPLGFSAPVQI